MPIPDTIPPYVYLSGPGGRQMFTETEWKGLLQLARDYGWAPVGTLPPSGRDDLSWDKTYLPARGQTVDEADAARLAAALERAWPDIPAAHDPPVTAPPHVSPVGLAMLDTYRGERRAVLRRLITSAQAGPLLVSPQPST